MKATKKTQLNLAKKPNNKSILALHPHLDLLYQKPSQTASLEAPLHSIAINLPFIVCFCLG